MAKPHALLPPSSADKWMVCTGWLAATRHLPNKSSVYADDGTKAHELLEMSLRLDLPPWEFTDDLDTANHVNGVVKWVKAYIESHPRADYYIERYVYWGKVIGHPTLGGTIDVALVDPAKELVVLDYKHGIGVLVDVEANRQLGLYLLGLIYEFGECKKNRLVIAQPRAAHDDGPVREYEMTFRDIDRLKVEAKYAAEANIEGTGERVAGKHCRFCQAAGTCKALTLYNLRLAIKEFSED